MVLQKICWTDLSAVRLQVKELAPLQLRDGDKKIPILTTDEGIGDRVFLEEAESAING